MIPYFDDDLAALALQRKLVSLDQLREAARSVPPDQRPPGWLAAALLGEMLLGDVEVQDLIRRLQHCGVNCRACDYRFAVLLAPQPRRVACLACGVRTEYRAEPRGVPTLPANWEEAGSVAGLDATRPESRAGGSSWGGDATVRGDASSAAGSKLDHSQDDSKPSGRFAPRVRLESSDLNPSRRGPFAPGTQVANYVIEKEISRGSMGVILAAHHAEIAERRVALKIMRDRHTDEEGLARFQREGEALARIDHPNVVRVHEAGHDDEGRAYLVMDLVEGRDLERLLSDERQLDLERAASLMAAVARGVAHINALGVVHRDLKLANVLITDDDRPVIADFGLVYLVDRATRLTMEGDRLGTPLYMAPEAIRGELEVDQRVDVYALGVMFYRLLSRKYPYHADSFSDLCDQVLHAPLGMPAGSALSRDARAVIEQALARDRDERYANCTALAEDLEALARGAAVEARPVGRLEKALRHRPWLSVVIALCLVLPVLTVAGRAALWSWKQETQAKAVAHLTGRLEAQVDELADLLAAAPAPPFDELLAQAAAEADEAGRRDVDYTTLQAARERLTQVAERRRAVNRLQRARARGDAESIGAALAALGTQPRPTDPTLGGNAEFLAECGWAALRAGDAAAALEALSEVPSPADGWSGPLARAAELRAWAHAYRGQPAEAERELVQAPGHVRRPLCLALAESAPDLAAARPQLAHLEAWDDPLVALRRAAVQTRLDGADARAEPHAFRTEAVASRWRWRALESEDQADGDVAKIAAERARYARARLCEGRAALALGWYDTAAEAFAAAEPLLPNQPTPAFALPLWAGSPPRLLPVRVAARLGLARARARALDPSGSEVACQAALADAAWSPALAGAAAVAETWRAALAGDAETAEAALEDAAEHLDGVGPVPRLEGLLAVLRGEAVGSDPDAAIRLEALGAAELALVEDEVAGAIPRARRALFGALLHAARAPTACLLAELALREGEQPAAQAWLLRAKQLDPQGSHWRLPWVEGLLALRAGDLSDADLTRVEEAFAAALAQRLQAVPPRLRAKDSEPSAAPRALALAAAEFEIRRRLVAAYDQANLPRRSLEALWQLVEAAREVPIPLTEIGSLLLDCRARALELEAPEPSREAIREAIEQNEAEKRRVQTLIDRTHPGAPHQAYIDLLASTPAVARFYIYALRGASSGMSEADRVLSGQAFDRLVLAAELRPCTALASGLSQRVAFERAQGQEGVSFMHSRMRGLIRLDTPDPLLPHERDLALRRALATVFTLDLDFEFTDDDLDYGVQHAWDYLLRRPREQAGSLLLGRMLIRAGDLGAARVHLLRARHLHLPLRAHDSGDGVLPQLYEAMTYALQGDPDAAGRLAAELRVEAETAFDRGAIGDGWHTQLGAWMLYERAFRIPGDDTVIPAVAAEAELLKRRR